ncbi:hypothetical protein DS318_24040 [Salmonella enterica subsp. enterica serovar Infantis]|nr:hypothetical protein [Salmonella enterica subsp. enterica serovar Infantis]
MNRLISAKEISLTEDVAVITATPTAEVICILTPVLKLTRKEEKPSTSAAQAVDRFFEAL